MRSGDVLAVMVIGATAVFGLAVQKGLQAAHDSAKGDFVEVLNQVEETRLDSDVRIELRNELRHQIRDNVRNNLRENIRRSVRNGIRIESRDWSDMSPEERAEFEAEMRELGREMEELGRQFEDMNFDFRFDFDGLDLNLDGLAVELDGVRLDLEGLEQELEQLQADGVVEIHDAHDKKKRKIIIRPPRTESGGN